MKNQIKTLNEEIGNLKANQDEYKRKEIKMQSELVCVKDKLKQLEKDIIVENWVSNTIDETDNDSRIGEIENRLNKLEKLLKNHIGDLNRINTLAINPNQVEGIVYINIFSYGIINVRINLINETVDDLLFKISDCIGKEKETIKLFYNDQQLQKGQCLRFYEIKNESIIEEHV